MQAKHAISLTLTMAVILLAGVVLTLAPAATKADERQYPDPGFHRVASIAEAQNLVPGRLVALPDDDNDYHLVSVSVSQHQGTWFVDATYRRVDGHLMTLTQSNTTWDHADAPIMTNVALNGGTAIAITSLNRDDLPVGQLYWQVGDVSVMLVTAGAAGEALVPFAALAQ